MTENDNIEITDRGTVESGKFTKIEKANKYRPKDGAEPLTVIEFSLMPWVSNKLEEELKPYVYDGLRDKKQLANIIESYLPKQMLDDMRQLREDQVAPSRVYVIRNIPEIPLNEARRLDETTTNDGRWTYDANTYGTWLATGIAEATRYNMHGSGPIIRQAGENTIHGGFYHKDPEDYSAFSGIPVEKPNLTETRFADLNALLDKAPPYVQPALIRESFAKGDWVNFTDLANSYMNENDQDCSQDITVEPNMMVVWSDHGSVFHKAMPKDSDLPPGTVTRIAVHHGFRR